MFAEAGTSFAQGEWCELGDLVDGEGFEAGAGDPLYVAAD